MDIYKPTTDRNLMLLLISVGNYQILILCNLFGWYYP